MSAQGMPRVAIVGRTNVGKSSLFNAIVGRRLTIVKDTPGVTRDRFETVVNRHGAPFILVDTGGLVGEEGEDLYDSVYAQTRLAIDQSSIIIALFDGLTGLHPHDADVVALLRGVNKPVIWVINKCEKPSTATEAAEFYSLGIESFHPISAAHNQGVVELISMIKDAVKVAENEAQSDESTEKTDSRTINIAIVGKPNVGKSTLVNRLYGEPRLITSPIPGTTRDSICLSLYHQGQEFVIADTAGLRKKARVDDQSVERFSNLRSLKSLAQCDTAVLLLDATQGAPNEQDGKIAGLIHDRGIPFIIVINKWDAVEKDHRTAQLYRKAVAETFKFARYAPILLVSALTGRGCARILPKLKEVYDTSRARLQTSKVNDLFETAFTRKPPPVYRGDPVKLYFATQVAVAPPTFVLFVNNPKKLHFSYQRYLKNCLRKEYPFEGSNIKLLIRKHGADKTARHGVR